MAATYIIAIVLVSLGEGILPTAAAADGLFSKRSSDHSLDMKKDSVQGVDAKAAETVQALDTNGNGKVDKSEIAAFAKTQGLSTQEVLADFQELDVNKDGELDQSEISGLLGDSDAGEASPVRQNVAKATAADEASALDEAAALVLGRKEATASVTAPSLRTQKSKELGAAGNEAQGSKDQAKGAVADAKGKSAEPSNRMGLDLAVLERDAQQQAGNVMASQLAQRAQELLARSTADERKAVRFDAEVRTLRGNATALAHLVNEETREAARKTVSTVAEKSLAELKQLQEQEHEAEVAADEHRNQAAKAMERVRLAQASLRDGRAS